MIRCTILALPLFALLVGCQPADVRDAGAKAVAVGVNKSCKASAPVRERFGNRVRASLDEGNDLNITCAGD